jgi:O-antigen/teichoic acid export membrane protein
LFPTLATIQSEGNWALLKKMYLVMLKRMGFFTIILLVALITVGQKLFFMWSKQGGQDLTLLFKLFAIFIMMIVMDNVSAVFLSALGLNKMQTIVAVVQGILALVFAYFFIHPFGIAGIALGSIIALLLTNFIYNPVYLVKQMNKNIR